MLRRYQHLVSEGMIVLPQWIEGVGQLHIGLPPKAGEQTSLVAVEQFPLAGEEEFEKCCHLFSASMQKLQDYFPSQEQDGEEE